jgi:hypothetical protein
MPSGAGLPHARPIAVPDREIDVTFAMTGAASPIMGGNGSTVFSGVSCLLCLVTMMGRGWFRGGLQAQCGLYVDEDRAAGQGLVEYPIIAFVAIPVIVALIFLRGRIGTLSGAAAARSVVRAARATRSPARPSSVSTGGPGATGAGHRWCYASRAVGEDGRPVGAHRPPKEWGWGRLAWPRASQATSDPGPLVVGGRTLPAVRPSPPVQHACLNNRLNTSGHAARPCAVTFRRR